MLVDNVLCGFYTAEHRVDQDDLVAFVGKHLPYYSVPERWIQIEGEFPLTPNGKVNRQTLRECAHTTLKRTDSAQDITSKVEPQPPVGSAQPANQGSNVHEVDISRDLEKGIVSMATSADCVEKSKDGEKTAIIYTSESSDLSTSSSSTTSIKEAPDALPVSYKVRSKTIKKCLAKGFGRLKKVSTDSGGYDTVRSYYTVVSSPSPSWLILRLHAFCCIGRSKTTSKFSPIWQQPQQPICAWLS